MEDFKDVMLSEPPQRYAAPVSHTNASNALSLESYKGILLCDRPADTRANRAAQQNPPFLPPGNTDMDRGNGNLGLQPSLESRSKIGMSRGLRSEAHRTQHPPTALSKHRRWLSSFASEVKKMQQSKEDQLQATKAKMAAIREREAAKRRGEGTLVTSDAPAVADVEPSKKPPTPPPATSSLPPIKKAASNKAASGKSKAKPRWAMTEEEAEDAEFAEARDLMDFAAELDFESFIKDFEVQEALAIMRDRVKEIAAEKGIDLDAARQARAANDEDNDDTMSIMTVSTTTGQPKKVHRTAKQQAKKMSERDENGDTIGDRPSWDDSTGNAIRGALQSDALKLAERVLQSSDALRKVHSKMSMARLLQDVAMELNVPAGTMRSVMMPAESSMPHPIVSVVAAEATGAVGSNGNFTTTKRVLTEMRHSKTKVQNLPYLYRCPSI